VIFRFTNIELGAALVRSMFGLNGNALTGFAEEIQLQSHQYLLAAAIFASTPVMKTLRIRLEGFAHSHGLLGGVWDVVFYSVLPVILLLLSTACLVGDSYNPFIYFQF
jgi:alginate O-acetyltransferase complex protein AlgI